MMADMKAAGCCKGMKANYSQTSSKPMDAKKAAKAVNNIGGSASPKRSGEVDTGGATTWVG